ncbi:MAG TPA: sugar phosphate isomerase/epimerase [Devosia sp.]|nr:sugar phosphate isomerase/epimerase [Devosia sp.]
MQKLLVLQSLWAMQNLRGAPGMRPLKDDVARIKAAGFDGFGSMLEDDETARRASALAAAEGLVLEGLALPANLAEVEAAIERAGRFGVHHLNLQLRMLPRTLEEASGLIAAIQRLIGQADVPVYIETHRGRLTNDLLFTLEILERHPDLRLLADLSHYVVARELELPIDPVANQQVLTVLDHAWAFHGRVAGSGQVQLPLSYAQHRPWIDQFVAWWSAGFASWRKRAAGDAELTFVCELGPQPYAISGPDGEDLTDRWEESLVLRDLARQAWGKSF